MGARRAGAASRAPNWTQPTDRQLARCPTTRELAGQDAPCAVGVDALSAYFDDELSPLLQGQMAVHVARCGRCASVLESWLELRALLWEVLNAVPFTCSASPRAPCCPQNARRQ